MTSWVSDLTSSLEGFYRVLSSQREGYVLISGSATITSAGAADIGGDGSIEASALVSVSATADITGTTPLQQGGGVALDAPYGDFQSLSQPPAFVLDKRAIEGADSVSFGVSGLITGRTSLSGADSITFSDSADLIGRGYMVGNPTITFTETALLVEGGGNAEGTTSVAFSLIAFATAQGELQGSADLTFSGAAGTTLGQRGVGVSLDEPWYWWGSNATASFITPWQEGYVLSGTATVSFSDSADLTGAGPGAIVGLSMISVDAVGQQPIGYGAIEGLASLSIDSTGTAVNGAAEQIDASVSITFSEDATLTADGELVGAETVTISVSNADLAQGRIVGSASITLSESADITKREAISASESITFSTSADGQVFSSQMVGSSLIQIGASATFRESGIARLVFSNDAALSSKEQVINSQRMVGRSAHNAQRVSTREGRSPARNRRGRARAR